MKTKTIKTCVPQPITNPLARFLILGSSTGLGLGFSPVAPGTCGSLLGLVFGFWLFLYPAWMAVIICAISLFIFTYVSDRAARHWGNMDDQRIVVDEVLGMGITLIGLRNITEAQLQALDFHSAVDWIGANAELVVLAFVIFRILDILKPFPAKMFDRQPSGFGIMADDVVSGLYGAIVLYGIAKIWLN